MRCYGFHEKKEDARTLVDNELQILAAKKPLLRCLSPDLVRSGMPGVSKSFPRSTYNMGVAETSCIDFAAGLATEGMLPVIYGMSAFLSMRSCEAIRTNLCYQNLHVVLLGNNTGLTQGPAGSTHYAMEDIAILRLFPRMTLIAPADPEQTVKALYAALELPGTTYIRMSNGRNEDAVYQDEYSFTIGKGIVLREGSDISIIACGIMVSYALEAARQLENDSIHATVVDMHTVKPLDKVLVRTLAMRGPIITVEDGFLTGGLGSSVSETVTEAGLGCSVCRLGIPDEFPGFGSFAELIGFYGYDVAGIHRAARQMLGRGNGR